MLFLGKLKIVGISLLVYGLFAAVRIDGPAADPRSPLREATRSRFLTWSVHGGPLLSSATRRLMDRIVAYEMVGTDGGGHLWNKAEYVESVRSRRLQKSNRSSWLT